MTKTTKRSATKKEPVYAIDHVVKMTELESYKLLAVETEMKNQLLSIQKRDLQLEKLTRDFEFTKKTLQDERQQFITTFESKNKTYQDYIKQLAEKYELDPHKMSFDTDSQILRDLRGEAEEPEASAS